MVKKKVLIPADEVDLNAVKYEYDQVEAPHLTGSTLGLFLKLLEAPIVGPMIITHLRKKNKMVELLKNTDIPESPMFKPEYPPQEPEQEVTFVDEAGCPEERVAEALNCLSEYDPAGCWEDDLANSFRYWKIRDFAYAYCAKLVTPLMIAERIISALDVFNKENPTTPLLISYDAEDVRAQAAASTQRFEEGKPISILDGIFMAIKDDIDCYPYPSNGATTWFHEVRPVKKDSISVSKVRNCGVILIGKANMHELGLGTTGNNANYG